MSLLALSLSQPWASLMYLGAKKYETRSWSAPRSAIGRLICIHAAKKYEGWALVMAMDDLPFRVLFANHLTNPAKLPTGAIIGIGRLKECVKVEELDASGFYIEPVERQLGNYEHGEHRVVWIFDGILRLPEPIPCRGALGLWRVPRNAQAIIERDLIVMGYSHLAEELGTYAPTLTASRSQPGREEYRQLSLEDLFAD